MTTYSSIVDCIERSSQPSYLLVEAKISAWNWFKLAAAYGNCGFFRQVNRNKLARSMSLASKGRGREMFVEGHNFSVEFFKVKLASKGFNKKTEANKLA